MQFTAYAGPLTLTPGQVGDGVFAVQLPPGPIAVYKIHAELVFHGDDANDDPDGATPATAFDAYLHHHVIGSRFSIAPPLPLATSAAPTKRDGSSSGAVVAEVGVDDHGSARHHTPLPASTHQQRYRRKIAFAAGMEARGTPQVFPFPYAFLTSENEDEWQAQVSVINTRGLANATRDECVQCLCKDSDVFWRDTINDAPFHPDQCNAQLQAEHNSACAVDTYQGGMHCCVDKALCVNPERLADASTVASNQTSTFFLKYVIDYSAVVPANRPLYVSTCCDATGNERHLGNLEYDIPACGDGVPVEECVHTLTTVQPVDAQALNTPWSLFGVEHRGVDVPDDRDVEIVAIAAHQNRGGLGVRVYVNETNELLCESLPRYGNGTAAGNEDGYVIEMGSCVLDAPHRLRSSTLLRIEAQYNSSQARTGVMSLAALALHDVRKPLTPEEFQSFNEQVAQQLTEASAVREKVVGDLNSLVILIGSVATGLAVLALIVVVAKRRQRRQQHQYKRVQKRSEDDSVSSRDVPLAPSAPPASASTPYNVFVIDEEETKHEEDVEDEDDGVYL
ncbi:TPA: hypothetical protein N0F65_009706 [Lagenidium giganteum]|uniref:Uncharacterized protein n=1 Tax=Lagenidium giganteum TaxID=4803 RepID=A0AAV2YGH4_9STRA|nr:TPA: hypothetical protein N0F65_009706 [Lagenidium giganteum]